MEQTRATSGVATLEYPATRWAVALLVSIALVVLTQLYSAIPLIAPVSADLGADVTCALSTAFSLCYAVGFLVWGPLADQFGRRRILLLGLAGLTILTAACALVSSVTMLGVLRGGQGFVAASFAPVALAYLAEAVPPARRGVALGAMATVFLVAGVGGQAIPEAMAVLFGWRLTFAAGSLLLALGFLALVVWLRESPRERGSASLARRFVLLGEIAARPPVIFLAAAHVTLLFSLVAMYTALGPHLAEFGLEPSQVLVLRLVGLPGMFVSLLSGGLVARLGRTRVAQVGFGVAALGLVLEALLAGSLVGLAAASLLFVSGVALAVPVMIGLFGESAAPNRASGMALNGFVLFLGASLGPLAAGAGIAFPWLLAGLATLLLLAVLSLAGVRRLERSASRPDESVAH